jgi:hypothetical protein
MNRRLPLSVLALGPLILGATVVLVGPAAAAKAPATLPNPCTQVTTSDITTAFAALGPTLTPSTVGTPTKSKPTNQGGFGPHTCETSFALPGSIEGDVLVLAPKLTSGTACPVSGQPGKKIKLGSTRALIEPNPVTPKVTRDITFPKGKACITIEVTLSSFSGGAVPASAYVSLAKAVLSKKG